MNQTQGQSKALRRAKEWALDHVMNHLGISLCGDGVDEGDCVRAESDEKAPLPSPTANEQQAELNEGVGDKQSLCASRKGDSRRKPTKSSATKSVPSKKKDTKRKCPPPKRSKKSSSDNDGGGGILISRRRKRMTTKS